MKQFIFLQSNLTSWDIQIAWLWLSFIKPAYITDDNCVFPVNIRWVCWHGFQTLNRLLKTPDECQACGETIIK